MEGEFAMFAIGFILLTVEILRTSYPRTMDKKDTVICTIGQTRIRKASFGIQVIMNIPRGE